MRAAIVARFLDQVEIVVRDCTWIALPVQGDKSPNGNHELRKSPMFKRILLTALAAALFLSPLAAAPPSPDFMAAGHTHTKGKKYVVWFRDPDDVCWRYYGTFSSLKAAEITAAEIKHAHPKWKVQITES
jgi:hypothetical protein